ncbi:MAG: TIM barrel protein [Candidatus Latescibacterota bacterium]|nr:TIM barrel protein [Candidatus Latescibacterota bacterium]
MDKIRQSVCFNPFSRDGLEPESLIRTAAEIGFDSIEMLPEEHWQQVKDAGMEIAIVVGHASLPDGLNKTANHDRIEMELRENIEKAAEWSIPSLICFSGNREGVSNADGSTICAEGLDRVKGYAEEKGVTLCMELLNSKVNHPDYQCDRTAWGVELCERVNSPRVRLLYDIYHMQIMEGDLIRTIRNFIDYIGHFHTAGNPERQDLDDEQEIYYPAVMRAIAATDYAGFVGHELRPKKAPFDTLRHCHEICDV